MALCWHGGQIYIDNFDEAETVFTHEVEALAGSESPSLALAEAKYTRWGAGPNPSNTARRVVDLVSRGVRRDGQEGCYDLPAGYALSLVCGTLWMLSQPRPPKKWSLVIMGR